MSEEEQRPPLHRLTELLAQADERMPSIVFQLLHSYYERGPLPADAAALAAMIRYGDLRINATQMADLEPQILQFFERTPRGLVPRKGVLAS